jgi:photosystem II stability/assembly factor-like uncharacterized protein
MITRFVTALALATLWSATARADWEEQHSLFGDGNALFAASTADCLHAVAVGKKNTGGSDEVLFLTTQDGKTWQAGQAPGGGGMIPTFFVEALMVEAKVGYLGGFSFLGGAAFYETQNGGQSWAQLNVQGATTVSKIFFLNDLQHGWALGDGKNVLLTTDRATWSLAPIDTGDATQNGVFFLNPQEGWISVGASEEDQETGESHVLAKGGVYHSTDGGQTWSALITDQPYTFGDLWFVNGQLVNPQARGPVGYMLGSDDQLSYLFKSIDGGKSWQRVDLPAHSSGQPLYLLAALRFVDDLHGFIAGGAGSQEGGFMNKPVALRTQDGGQSWAYLEGYSGQGGMFVDVAPCNQDAAFFVGDMAKVEKWTAEGYVVPEGGTGEGMIVGEGGELVPAELGPWYEVLGGFNDGQCVPNQPGGSEEAAVAADGAFLSDGSGQQTVCTTREVKQGGCAVGGQAAPGGALGLLLAALAGLGLARRRARVASLLVLGLVLGGLPACSESTKTVKDCEVITVDQTIFFDTVGGDGEAGQPQPGGSNCLIASAKPALPLHEGERAAWTNPFIAFARHEGELDRLYVLDPESGGSMAFTDLPASGVAITNPAWSPDHQRLGFVSDFFARHSSYRANVFVLDPEAGSCFMATPSAEEGVIKPAGAPTGQLAGFFKGASGGVLMPIVGASVAPANSLTEFTTVNQGAFQIQVPAGNGTLVFRGSLADGTYGWAMPYAVQEGGAIDLGTVAGRPSGASLRVDSFAWLPDGSGFLVLQSGLRLNPDGKEKPFQEIARYFLASGDFEPVVLPLSVSDNAKLLLAPAVLAEGALVVPWVAKEGSLGKISIVLEGRDPLTMDAPGLGMSSRVVVSPNDILAYIGKEGGPWQLYLVGADSAGNLQQETRAAFGGLEPVPGQLDWSPDAAHLVVTHNAGGGTDLLELDVNTLATRDLTADHAAHDPCWYGK